MDAEPWISAAMAGELRRAGLLRPWSGPSDRSLGDPRDYLYVELDAGTIGAAAMAEPLFALGVRLAGDPELYRSDHGADDLALAARGALRTAVRLPPATRAEDVVELRVIRAGGARLATEVVISDVMEAFMLDSSFRPRRVGVRVPAPVRLGRLGRRAILWSRLADPRADLSLEGGSV